MFMFHCANALIFIALSIMLALPWYEALQDHAHENGPREEPEEIHADRESPLLLSTNQDDESRWKWRMQNTGATSLGQPDCPLQRLLATSFDGLLAGDWHNVRTVLVQRMNAIESHDVKVVASDGTVRTAHKVILAIHSEFFRNSFLDKWWSSRDDAPIVIDCLGSLLDPLLTYFYTGDVTDILQSEELMEFVIIGRKLLIDDLVDELVPHLVAALDAANVCSLLSLADCFDLKLLRDKCSMFVIQQLVSVEQCPYYDYLGPRVCQALRTLSSLYGRCVLENGPIYDDVRELLAMVKEALLEAEETYAVGKARNDEEIRKWEISVGSSTFPSREGLPQDDSHAWRERLGKVEVSLSKQHERLVKMRLLYEEQMKAMHILLCNHIPELDDSS